MDALRKEYYLQEGYKEDEIPKKVQRIRHKLMAEAISRMPELAAILNLPDEELIKLYYEGTIPRSKETKKKLYKLLPGPAEQVVAKK
jgi:hypothetical protein